MSLHADPLLILPLLARGHAPPRRLRRCWGAGGHLWYHPAEQCDTRGV